MSDSDLSGRLPRPRIALERRPLSNSASTASCSMRFSLRRMTSGARCEMSFCRRLLRLMTRRYRSLRSDVAKRPPSSGTSGRRSGGITGMTSRIIHSGLLRTSPESPELRNAATEQLANGRRADVGEEGGIAFFLRLGLQLEVTVFIEELIVLDFLSTLVD